MGKNTCNGGEKRKEKEKKEKERTVNTQTGSPTGNTQNHLGRSHRILANTPTVRARRGLPYKRSGSFGLELAAFDIKIGCINQVDVKSVVDRMAFPVSGDSEFVLYWCSVEDEMNLLCGFGRDSLGLRLRGERQDEGGINGDQEQGVSHGNVVLSNFCV